MNGNSNGTPTSNTENSGQNGSNNTDNNTPIEAYLKNLENALHAVRELRWHVKDVFNDLNDEVLSSSDRHLDTERKGLKTLKQKLENADTNIKYHLK